jgi:hypothetical protein
LRALRARRVAAVRGVPISNLVHTGPRRHRRPEERVDGRALVGRGFGVEEAEIH